MSAAIACSAPASPPPTTLAPSGPDAGAIATAVDAAPVAVDLTPPTLRLPDTFAPTRYRAALAIDPARPDFTGAITIEGTLVRPTALIWLDADGLTVTRAVARAGGTEVALSVVVVEHDFVGLRATRELPAGAIELALDYQGQVSSKDRSGVYPMIEGGHAYLFTQFEALDARRVFPCVDEPAAKVPWQLTLTVPTGLVALANTAIDRELDNGDGTTTHAFAETRPLPSYLLAFAIGPFELVDGGTTPGGAPIRIATLAGKGAQATWTAEATRRLAALIEGYFGIPYPYDKLDSVATAGKRGAMENAGLITYGDRFLQHDPAVANDGDRRDYVSIGAHEIAHQWAGDLVTMQWWDDLWLNEAFATWMASKMVGEFDPRWDTSVQEVKDRAGALWADGLVSARRIRQPIHDAGDIDAAFDGITYQKGAAVIRMFERHVGADTFQAAVRAYLTAHAHGNATADDFLAALDAAAGTDISGPFRSFLDQAGAPLITSELRCDRGEPPVLTVRQQRWIARGSTAPAGDPPRWQIPMCVAYGDGKQRMSTCTLLTEERAELTLEGACPRWVLPNEDGGGYFRIGLTSDQLAALLSVGWKRLRATERILLADEVRAGIEHGDLRFGAALDLVPKLIADGSRLAINEAAAIAADAHELASPKTQPKLAAWIRKQFGARARKLGWVSSKDDDLDRVRLRDTLVPLVAARGDDRTLGDRAVKLFARRGELSAKSRLAVMRAAVRRSNAVFEQVLAAVGTVTDFRDLAEHYDALAAVTTIAQAETALALLLEPATDLKTALRLLTGLAGQPRTQPAAEAFVRAHFDELRARITDDRAVGLVGVVGGSCDPDKRVDALAWAEQNIAPLTGGPQAIAQTFEEMDQCIARRAALRPEVDAWLKKQRR